MIFNRNIVFLILVAFSNLIALQNQYVICKESSGKISLETYSSKCCNKNDFFCCFGIRDSKLQYTLTKQSDTCADTQLEISVFSKQTLATDTIEQYSSSIIDSNIFALDSFTKKYPRTTNSTNIHSQRCISSTVLLI